MAKIHPTAVVHPSAQLAEDVEVGPHCLVESDVSIGPRCVLRASAVIRRYTTLGADNLVDAGCVLGGEPQDLKFDPAGVSYLRIGDRNVFRECVTISRATTPGGATLVGSGTYWMAYSHAGHDVTVGDEVILVNGSAVGGHCTIEPRVFLSAHVVVHQFCWIGQMVMTEGNASIRSHVPPFTMLVGRNRVLGLNVVGLRRAKDLTELDRAQIKEAYRITYREGLRTQEALREMERHADWRAPAASFREFVGRVAAAQKPFNRGLASDKARAGED